MDVLRYLPPPILVPIVILYFGRGDAAVVAIIVVAAVWLILLNSFDGVRNADPLLAEIGAIYRLPRHKQFSRLALPSALPQVIVGLRLAGSVALQLAVVGEMLAGSNGIGYEILLNQRQFRYPEVYASIVVLGIFGMTINGVLVRLERSYLDRRTDTRSPSETG